jgi:glutathione S-transferase
MSPRSFKVLLAANQLGLDYEYCFCDLTKGVQKTDVFTALNPNQKAPALEHGDFELWESNAIVQYLATLKPQAGLLLDDERGRADVARWMFWESTTWDPACAILAFERVVKAAFGMGAPDPAEVEKALARFSGAARILDAHLAGGAFICGERLTAADISIGAALILAEPAQLPLEPYAEIRRWAAAMTALPAWKATLAMQQTAVAA